MKKTFKAGIASFVLLVAVSCTKEHLDSPAPAATESNNIEILTTSTITANTVVVQERTYTPIPAKIEAEDYASMSGLETETCSEGGKDVAFVWRGDYLILLTKATTAGTYTLSFRVASATGGQLQLYNGDTPTNIYVTIPATGSGQIWATVTTSVTLPAGQINMRIVNKSGKFGLNWLSIDLGAKTAEPLWWLNPLDYAYSEIRDPR